MIISLVAELGLVIDKASKVGLASLASLQTVVTSPAQFGNGGGWGSTKCKRNGFERLAQCVGLGPALPQCKSCDYTSRLPLYRNWR